MRKLKRKYKDLAFLLFLVAGMLALLALFFVESLWSMLLVFVLSLAIFHSVLYRYSKHEKIWKSTDYLFEVVAILSIIAAVAGLNEAGKQKKLQEEFSKRKLAQVNFIYAIESAVTNDCDPLKSRGAMWSPTPEPISGECDRIKHFLPQMKFEFDQETGPGNMTAEDNWGRNLEYEGYKLNGSWAEIQSRAAQFVILSRETQAAIAIRDSGENKNISLSEIDKVFYWYHILAFLLALKIARITMDVFKG